MKKRILYIAGAAACLLLGIWRWIDLVNYTDPATGFVTAGSAWMRYAVLGAGVLLMLVFSTRMSKHPAALRERCPVLGALLVLTGVSLVFFGAITVLEWYFAAAAWVDALAGPLALLAGVWFVVRGVSAFHAPAAQEPARAAAAIIGALFFLWLLISRFAVDPASTERVNRGTMVLSGLAALWFVSACIKVFCLPGSPVGRNLYFSGMSCFFLCTCCELPQFLAGVPAGQGMLTGDPWTVPLGLLGLCGLCAAWYPAGEDLTKEPE